MLTDTTALLKYALNSATYDSLLGMKPYFFTWRHR